MMYSSWALLLLLGAPCSAADTGWLFSTEGDSCEDACAALSTTATCNARSIAQMGAVHTLAQLYGIDVAVGASTSIDGAPLTTSAVCGINVPLGTEGTATGSASGLIIAPAVACDPADAEYLTTEVSPPLPPTCSSSSQSHHRVCCCVAAASTMAEAKVACPLTSADCDGGGATPRCWNAPTRSCLTVCPLHSFSFVGTSQPLAITDAVGGGIATRSTTAVAQATGVYLSTSSGGASGSFITLALNGVFGGPTTIEIVAMWSSFNTESSLFDCGGANPDTSGTILDDGKFDNVLLGIRLSAAGTLYWGVKKNVASASGLDTTGPVDIELNKRYHIVATVEGNTMVVYINGQEKGRLIGASNLEPAYVQRDSWCSIGKPNWPDRKFFDGEVSSLRIYSGAMSAAQAITACRNRPLGSPTVICPLHAWDFAGAADQKTIIDSIQGVEATLKGGATTNGKGVLFDGIDGYIDLNNMGVLTQLGGGEITLEMVVTWSSFQSLSKIFECRPTSSNMDNSIHLGNSQVVGKVLWGVSYDSTEVYALSSTAHLDVNTRYHIIVTIQRHNGFFVFLDGANIVTQSSSAALVAPVVERGVCTIGRSAASGSAFFKGTVLSLKVYSGAMTQSEVTEAFQRSFVLDYHWDFTGSMGAASGHIVSDTINGIAGTLVGDAFMHGGGVEFNHAGRVELNLEARKLGGSMSIASVVKYHSWTSYGRVFDCAQTGSHHEEISLGHGSENGEAWFSIYKNGVAGFAFTSGNAVLTRNVWMHLVATVRGRVMKVYVNGVLVATDTKTSTWEPRSLLRGNCHIGDGIMNTMDGEVRMLKIYSGAMTQEAVTAEYEYYINNPTNAPTSAPTTDPNAITSMPSSAPSHGPSAGPTNAPSHGPSSAPTSAPLVAAPTSAPSSSPSTAPTAAPTQALGNLVAYSQVNVVSEYAGAGRGLEFLTVGASSAAAGEVATVVCTSANSSVAHLYDHTPIRINSNGVVNGRTGFAVLGVWDRMQHPVRRTTIECTVTSAGASVKPTAFLSVPVLVHGVAQPSFHAFCVNTSSTNASMLAEEDVCGPSLTTNGDDRIVVIGGNCDSCPQPPFSATTSVTVGGIAIDDVTVFPGGHELAFTTPSIAALKAISTFAFNKYYPVEINTPVGEQGSIAGSVVLGPGAPTATHSGELACAQRGLCPPGVPATSGAIYIERCLGFPNPITDMRWNTTTDPDLAAQFAYGTPPNCRPCPEGCRCPGGDRCHVVDGWWLEGETLPEGGDATPPACHADPAIAKRRCHAYSPTALGECNEGYTGVLCASCARDFYPLAGGFCIKCQPSGDVAFAIAVVSAVFLAITCGAFALVAIVQSFFGRDVKSGAVRSVRFAGWIVGALAAQAQIGRTSGGSLPDVLQGYYTFLMIFEVNPDAAQPSACAGSASTTAVLAMCISTIAATAFVLLSLPCLARPLIYGADKARAVVCRTWRQRPRKKTKDSFTRTVGSSSSSSRMTALGESNARLAAEESRIGNPMVRSIMSRAVSVQKMRGRKLGIGGPAASIELTSLGKRDSLATPGHQLHALDERGSNPSARPSHRVMMSNPLALQAPAAAAGDGGVGVSAQSTIFRGGAFISLPLIHAEIMGYRALRDESGDDGGLRGAGCGGLKQKMVVALKKKKQQKLMKKLMKQKKKEKEGSPAQRKTSQRWIGYLRKGLGGSVFLFHPLVANIAFKAVHCVVVDDYGNGDGGSGSWVLASAPNVLCDSSEHLPIFILALVAIAISVIGFPLYATVVLSRSAGWWHCCCGAGVIPSGDESGGSGIRGMYSDHHDEEHDSEGGGMNTSIRAEPNSEFFDDAVVVTPRDQAPYNPSGGGDSDAKDDCMGYPVADEDLLWRRKFGLSAPRSLQSILHPRSGPLEAEGEGEESAAVAEVEVGEQTQPHLDLLHSGIDPLSGPGPISRAICLRSPKCVACMVHTRASFDKSHHKERPATRYAWTSFTQSDYKPEFFFFRVLFFNSITALAACNNFLNPDYMITSSPSSLFAAQMLRFSICTVAVTLPCVGLLATFPMKTSSIWKLPLRIACAVVSTALLAFNLFSWWTRRAARAVGAHPVNLEVFAYIVMGLSLSLLLLMAALFVVFVVFRGAAQQREVEEADTKADAEGELVEFLHLYMSQQRVRRAMLAWRGTTASQKTFQQRRSTADGMGAVSRRASDGGGGHDDGSGTLPRGWEVLCDSDGSTYYHCSATGETRWTRPCADDACALPFGWTEHIDGSGKIYFHNDATGETSWSLPTVAATAALDSVVLPPGWLAHRSAPPENKIYYANASTGETSWEKPKMLPHGWTQLADEASGKLYFHNAITGETSWERPADLVALERAKRVSVVMSPRNSQHADLGALRLEFSSVILEEETTIEDEPPPPPSVVSSKKKKRKKKRAVRWAWTPRTDIPLGEALFKNTLEEGDDAVMIPPYLIDLFGKIFKIADRNCSGILSTVELTLMLQKRAKGTALDGDSHAIFSLKTLLAQQASLSQKDRVLGRLPSMKSKIDLTAVEANEDHGEIGIREFARGMMKAVVLKPNGAVAEWILKELQDEAAEWVTHETEEGKLFYLHETEGKQQWGKPELVSEMERCKALAAGGRGAGGSPRARSATRGVSSNSASFRSAAASFQGSVRGIL